MRIRGLTLPLSINYALRPVPLKMWPVDADRSRRRRRDYGGHFQVAMRDLHESDDLRVLDFNAERAFASFNSKSSPHP
jgi:hypothetical protein